MNTLKIVLLIVAACSAVVAELVRSLTDMRWCLYLPSLPLPLFVLQDGAAAFHQEEGGLEELTDLEAKAQKLAKLFKVAPEDSLDEEVSLFRWDSSSHRQR